MVILSRCIGVVKEMSIHYQQYMVSKNLKFRERYGSLYQSHCGIQQTWEWSGEMRLLQIYPMVEESISLLIATCSNQQYYNISKHEITPSNKVSRSLKNWEGLIRRFAQPLVDRKANESV